MIAFSLSNPLLPALTHRTPTCVCVCVCVCSYIFISAWVSVWLQVRPRWAVWFRLPRSTHTHTHSIATSIYSDLPLTLTSLLQCHKSAAAYRRVSWWGGGLMGRSAVFLPPQLARLWPSGGSGGDPRLLGALRSPETVDNCCHLDVTAVNHFLPCKYCLSQQF